MIAYSKCAVKFVYKDHSRELENVNNLKNETVVCYIEVFFEAGLSVYVEYLQFCHLSHFLEMFFKNCLLCWS
jgi:hypothetical protein